MYQEITNTSSLVNIWNFFIHFVVRREMLGLFFSAYFSCLQLPFSIVSTRNVWIFGENLNV
jgi:hypothetical protein